MYLLFLMFALFAAQVRIETAVVPPPVVSEPYSVQLQASGGTPPYRWSLMEGSLPSGLRLDASGLLVGTPATPGATHFTIHVTDSSTPPQSATRELTADVKPAIALTWKRAPRVENGGIFGSVEFTSNLHEAVELTLIVVAVNEFNKSFVLGYEHANIPADGNALEVPLGFTLPHGAYVVHADAYAETPGGKLLHTRMQLEAPLQVLPGA